MLFVCVSVKIRCPSIVSTIHIIELLQQLGCGIASHGHQGLDSIEILETIKGAVNVSRGQDVIVKGPSFSVNVILRTTYHLSD